MTLRNPLQSLEASHLRGGISHPFGARFRGSAALIPPSTSPPDRSPTRAPPADSRSGPALRTRRCPSSAEQTLSDGALGEVHLSAMDPWQIISRRASGVVM